jgi:hypothetical protein
MEICSRPDAPEREEARREDSPPVLSKRDPILEIRTVAVEEGALLSMMMFVVSVRGC